MVQGSYLEIEPGMELYYEEQGEGPALVFIPGWTFSTEVFSHQFDHFSKTHRVVSFDPRSQGRSTVVLHGNDYGTQSADLCKLMAHLELKDPVLVGWSAASLTVWGVVRQQGTTPLKGVVTIDMPPAPLTGRAEDWNEFEIADAAAFYQSLMTPKGHRDLVTWYARTVMVQRDLSSEELEWIVRQSTTTPHWVAAAYAAAEWFSDYLPEAKQIDQNLPALFVVAESSADEAIPYLEQHLPNAEVRLMGGHFMFWEYPEEFNLMLDAYLQALGLGSHPKQT